MSLSKYYTIQPYRDGGMGWWVSDTPQRPNCNAEGLITPRDELKIQFLHYKQTIHIVGLIKEEFNLLQCEKVITVHPSELRKEDTASIMQSPSMCMIRLVLDTIFPSLEKAERLEIEEGILRIVRNPATPMLVPPNHRVFVKAIDGIQILHDASEKSVEKTMHDHLEATKSATCVICFDDINLSKPSRLPCLHLFHHGCIIAGWRSSKSVPIAEILYPMNMLHGFDTCGSKESGCSQ